MPHPIIQAEVDEFEKLDIHISPPNSIADEELREKLKFFVPIVYEMLKPSLKSFLSAALHRAVEKIKEEEEAKRWEMPCEGCGVHPSFWKTIVESKEWQEWEKIANKEGFDYDESRELGAFSPNHRDAFFKFIASQN